MPQEISRPTNQKLECRPCGRSGPLPDVRREHRQLRPYSEPSPNIRKSAQRNGFAPTHVSPLNTQAPQRGRAAIPGRRESFQEGQQLRPQLVTPASDRGLNRTKTAQPWLRAYPADGQPQRSRNLHRRPRDKYTREATSRKRHRPLPLQQHGVE